MNYEENLLAAREFIAELDNADFTDGLVEYTCETAHCFGGWLPHIPHFVKLGVYDYSNGLPAMEVKSGCVAGYNLSRHLFGVNLFCVQRSDEEDYGGPKEAILRRIDSALEDLARCQAPPQPAGAN